MEEVVGSSERALSSGFTHHQILSGHSSSGHIGGDRFIPCRSAMDMGFARAMLTESRKEKVNASSPYQMLLAEAMLQNRTRILTFKAKPPVAMDSFIQEVQAKSPKQRRYIPRSAKTVLYVPEVLDDYDTNLLDWGRSNVLAIAMDSNICLWDASRGSALAFITVVEDFVTSVSWAPDGRHLAVGLDSSAVQLWDTESNKLLRMLTEAHGSRVGSLCWNNHLLTTGGTDGMVVNSDMRVRSHIVQTYRGHQKEVCGVKWSGSGRLLASGGGDNLVHIWDVAMASRNNNIQNQWLHRLEDHTAVIRALAWCPFQSNVLASGGGGTDRCIKFWSTHTGDCLNSVDTGSEVCSLLWSKTERELLSSHGFTKNQLALWKYPSMGTIVELTGHKSSILFTAQSPDGCTVASMADETLRFWNIFGTPKVLKAANLGPFNNSRCHIRKSDGEGPRFIGASTGTGNRGGPACRRPSQEALPSRFACHQIFSRQLSGHIVHPRVDPPWVMNFARVMLMESGKGIWPRLCCITEASGGHGGHGRLLTGGPC